MIPKKEELCGYKMLDICSTDETPTTCLEPPEYRVVLLENHLEMAKKHPELYTSEMLTSIESFYFYPTEPPSNPYRTYHSILDKNYDDGSGDYFGELDPKRRRNGFGTMVYINGDIFTGFWIKNKRQGFGSYFWAETGSVYTGLWKNNERYGKGEFIFGSQRKTNGIMCSGEWIKGKIQGKGSITFINDEGIIEKLKDVDMTSIL